MDLGDAELCHGTLSNPEAFRYLMFADEIVCHMANQEKPLAFVGHSHIPACYRRRPGSCEIEAVPGFLAGEAIEVDPSGGTYWVFNAGSVGRPRDMCRNAKYVTIEGPSRGPYEITLRKVEYDAETAARKIREAGLPVKLADDLLPKPNIKNIGRNNAQENS
jgi:diadenosine tetraphosphatase ApaH/serine/threonine PP2A family protein phosphatase